jgi:hypothetical protein
MFSIHIIEGAGAICAAGAGVGVTHNIFNYMDEYITNATTMNMTIRAITPHAISSFLLCGGTYENLLSYSPVSIKNSSSSYGSLPRFSHKPCSSVDFVSCIIKSYGKYQNRNHIKKATTGIKRTPITVYAAASAAMAWGDVSGGDAICELGVGM